jgi:hypothetical protein
VHIQPSPLWVPAREVKSADRRELGILIRDLRLEADGRALSLGEPPVRPLPLSDERPWSREAFAWYYAEPGHLVDSWLWYLDHAGPAGSCLLAVGLPLAALALAALSLSGAFGLARLYRAS